MTCGEHHHCLATVHVGQLSQGIHRRRLPSEQLEYVDRPVEGSSGHVQRPRDYLRLPGMAVRGRVVHHGDTLATELAEELVTHVVDDDEPGRALEVGHDPIVRAEPAPSQEMTASSVFFSALGCEGLRGALALASSIFAPIAWSCFRPRPSRTLGNHSCSSSSMW